MTFKETMKEIESHEFAARLNVAGDFRTFLHAAQEQEAVHILLRELDSLGKRRQLLFRVLELSRQQVDFRYENQWDTALAVYVWLLSLKDLVLAQAAAEAAARAPRCWWAARVSRHILLETPTRNDADAERCEVIFVATSPKVIQISDSGETTLYASFLSAMTGMLTIPVDVSIRLGLQDSTIITQWSLESSGHRVLPRHLVDSDTRFEERLAL